jgi:hypothetical protein
MEKQQTAVDWFINKDSQVTIDFLEGKITQLQLAAKKATLIEQAKQMEKEQIVNAVNVGYNMVTTSEPYDNLHKGDNYYNETYGVQKE